MSIIAENISHFKIIEKLGAGGMGEIYLAENQSLERQVAIKFLTQHLTKNIDNLERFKREAKAAASLNHPNIITIYEIGEFEEHIDQLSDIFSFGVVFYEMICGSSLY